MTLSRRYLRSLVTDNKAEIVGYVCQDAEHGVGSNYYAIVERSDIDRTDHYRIPGSSPEYRWIQLRQDRPNFWTK